VRNLDDLRWLVAGTLWFQWDTGISATPQLRDALSRLRGRHHRFDEYVAKTLAGPKGAAQEAAFIIDRLSADALATLPSANGSKLDGGN
jgi:hypothetical protein